MNKTLIIIGREFSTRVRKKSFLVVTLIVPILMALFYAFLLWIILKDDTQERKIAVVNRSAIESPFQQINNTTFDYTGTDITEESAPEFLNANNYYAVIWLNADVMENPEVPVYSFSQVPMDLKNEIALQLQEKIESIKRDSVIAIYAEEYMPLENRTISTSPRYTYYLTAILIARNVYYKQR